MKILKTLVVMLLAAGCAVQSTGPTQRQPQPQPTAGNPAAMVARFPDSECI